MVLFILYTLTMNQEKKLKLLGAFRTCQFMFCFWHLTVSDPSHCFSVNISADLLRFHERHPKLHYPCYFSTV